MILTAATAIHPLPGRDPSTALRVAVYKNLHRGAWSIRAEHGPHKGRLLGHASAVALTDCTMRVGRAAALRIANGQAREVHAWVIGTLACQASIADPTRLVYRPHERPEFYAAATGRAVWAAPSVIFTDSAYITTPRPNDHHNAERNPTMTNRDDERTDNPHRPHAEADVEVCDLCDLALIGAGRLCPQCDHCATERCTAALDDGDGFDGYCGNCADRRDHLYD